MSGVIEIPVDNVMTLITSGGGALIVLGAMALANKKLKLFIDRDMFDLEKVATADQIKTLDTKIKDLDTKMSSQVSEIKEHMADARLSNVKEFVSKTDLQSQMTELKAFLESRLTQIDTNVNRLYEEQHRR